MRHTYLLFAWISCIILGIYLVSCKKPIELDDSDKQFPIELTATVDSDNITLNWTSKKVTNFERVVILRSIEEIPAGTLPAQSFNIQVALNSTDGVTTFTEPQPIFQKSTWYKVLIQIGTRFVESNSVKIENSSFSAAGSPESTLFHPDSSWIISFVFSNTGEPPRLVVNDYNKSQTIATTTLQSVFDLNTVNATTLLYQGKENLIISTNDYKLLRYSLPELDLLEEKSMNYAIWSVLASPVNNWVISTQYDYYQGTTVRKINDLNNIFKAFERPGNYYIPRKLAFFDPSNLSILEVGSYDIVRYRLNPTTGNEITSYFKQVSTNGYSPFVDHIPMSKDRKFFIPNFSGAIFNQELELTGTLTPSSQASFVDFSFAPSGNYVYTLEQNNQITVKSIIRKLTYPGLQEVSIITNNDVISKRIHALSDDQVIYLGTGITQPIQYGLRKITL